MENYVEAALRHHDDAYCLGQRGQFDNASHLIGIAAECALKSELQTNGLPANKVHLPSLVLSFRAQMKGRTIRTPQAVNQLVDGPRSFQDWSINDRYRGDGHVDQQLWEQRRLKTGKLFAAIGLRRR